MTLFIESINQKHKLYSTDILYQIFANSFYFSKIIRLEPAKMSKGPVDLSSQCS